MINIIKHFGPGAQVIEQHWDVEPVISDKGEILYHKVTGHIKVKLATPEAPNQESDTPVIR